MSQTKAQLVEGLNINTSAPADALVINSSGNVGIGTSSPDSTLELAAGPPRLKLTRNTTASTGNDFGRIVFENSVGTILSRIDCESTSGNTQSALTFSNGGSERLRIDSSGNVGIGTTSPANNLDIAVDSNNEGIRISSSTNVFGKIDFHANRSGADNALGILDFNWNGTQVARIIGGTGTDTTNKDDGALQFHTAAAGSASEAMRIDSSGRLLVGTSTSLFGSSNIQCGNTGGNNFTGIRYSTGAGGAQLVLGHSQSGTIGSNVLLSNNDYIGSVEFRAADGTNYLVGAGIDAFVDGTPGTNDMPGRLVFSTTADGASSPTERLRIDSSGNVGIGTSSPAYQLDVQGSGNSRIRVKNTSVSGEAQFHHDGNGDLFIKNSVSGRNLSFVNNGSERMRIGSSGTVEVLTNQFTVGTHGTTGLQFINDGTFGTLQSADLKFRTASTERMRIDSSGRLLVGTSTANAAPLTVAGTTEALGSKFRAVFGDGYIDADSGRVFGGNPAEVQIQTATNNRPAVLSLGGPQGTSEGLGMINFFNSGNSDDHRSRALIAAVQEGSNSNQGAVLRFYTAADGGSSPTERMRIRSDGFVNAGGYMGTTYHRFNGIDASAGDNIFTVSGYQPSGGTNQDSLVVFASADSASTNTAPTIVKVFRHASNQRSINAAGSVNASGNDYAEYMTKAGNFTLAKGDVCGINSEGKLTNVFADAISFVVKSTDPSYVGGDVWHKTVGAEPGGYDDDRTEEEIAAAKVVYEEALEAARQLVDRIAFSGQVPVNVTGSTPGQYIVPVTTADGGITGEAKNEADLTLVEYMQAVGKVIAIEDDGRAKIVVKVA